MKSRTPIKLEVYRGPLIECVHSAISVVVDDKGGTSHFSGNYDYVVYPRSSIKPFQAIPFVQSGAIEKFGLDERMIALACSSHRAEEQHLKILNEWIEKINIKVTDLECGGEPTPLHNNCSGKHLGFISTSLFLNESHKNYIQFDHPVQLRLRKVLTGVLGHDHQKIPWGVDGCGIPTFGVPLLSLAQGFQKLAQVYEMSEHGTGSMSALQVAALRIIKACQKFPELISGRNEFASEVIKATDGNVLLKSGAEGVYAGVIFSKNLGFALKIEDGAQRAAAPAVIKLLSECDVLNKDQLKILQNWVQPIVTNSLQQKVGEIRVRV